MKIPSYIYTHRWIVLTGLVVSVLICLVVVLSFKGKYSHLDTFDNNRTSVESSESAHESKQSIPKPSTSKPVLIDSGAVKQSDASTTAALTLQKVRSALEAKNSQVLYELLSSEMKSIFTIDSVAIAFTQAESLTLIPTNEITVDGEWAKQEIIAVNAKGEKTHYRVILHLEDGKWTLYGTEKLN